MLPTQGLPSVALFEDMNIECFPPRPGVCSPPGRDDGGYLSENPNVCLRTGLPADRGCPVVRLSSPNHGDASRTRDLPFRTPNCPARTCLFPRTRGLPTYLPTLVRSRESDSCSPHKGVYPGIKVNPRRVGVLPRMRRSTRRARRGVLPHTKCFPRAGAAAHLNLLVSAM